jgi:hypothetical protein
MQGEPKFSTAVIPEGAVLFSGTTDVRAAARRPKSKIHLRMATGEMIGVSPNLSTRMSERGESLDPVRMLNVASWRKVRASRGSSARSKVPELAAA